MVFLTDADHRFRTCPVPDVHSWAWRTCSVAVSSSESRSSADVKTDSGVACSRGSLP